MPTHVFILYSYKPGVQGAEAARCLSKALPTRRCSAVLLVATAQSAAQPIALLRGAGISMGISQLSGIRPAKRHIFQRPALQGHRTELGQVTPRAPRGRGVVTAVPEAPLETPVCACCAFLAWFFVLFFNVKEGRNETICLGRSGMDSRKVLFWVNVKHFTGALSPCVCVCVCTRCWSLF